MKAINKKNDKIICDNLITANTFWKRFKGLLGKSSMSKGEGLLITPCGSIHSIGMKFLFDAVFLDKNNKVVFVIKKMRPMKHSPVIWQAKSVIELEAGTIEACEINLGDKIELID